MQYFISVVQEIGAGISSSLLLFVLTLIFSMPLGLLVCFGRMSKIKPLSMVFNFVISVLRGTPLMLQLVVVFFGPYYVFGMNVSNTWRFWAAIVGFSINYAAYFAEIYRSGIQAIPKGQYEAAEVLGYTKTQTFCKIIFPQMVKHVLPPVTNEIITLTKDTSLAFVLAYAEMFTLAKQVAASDASIAPLFVAGLFYYVFNYVVAFVMERLERKLAYYQ
ncbi:MAG: amino acid ABC transporter permease [Eubacteriales bacterium]|jgi:His/Glu/Gln/Arg/opine family amino acid ABC transporter permease subunit|uniref:Amino acid ABC transporter permease n=1 Tax=Butyricicoccus intestinisimiae TaxID=2841509 RepID=A0ABS6EPZ0_9FIRM|nr:amino acid ABC transporter permease [Butyricicoccus intestinisimiae]MBU5489191.1 amino acid ABC transporter permease [Butyricicoccus intestinisimiae]MDO5805962.1 amino acid ABC transporter permease [Eubacteriales bacterium]MEE0327317.1 amino acid ABC transporter permease [Butyricicoccus sp.]